MASVWRIAGLIGPFYILLEYLCNVLICRMYIGDHHASSLWNIPRTHRALSEMLPGASQRVPSVFGWEESVRGQ